MEYYKCIDIQRLEQEDELRNLIVSVGSNQLPVIGKNCAFGQGAYALERVDEGDFL